MIKDKGVDIVDRVPNDIYKYGITSIHRAIPSAYDGLKIVHRRILYTCWLNKIYKPTKVSKITGLVMALHPHGNSSIEDAIVRLSNDGVVQNHALLKPEGHFGSLDSSSSAAPRYISSCISQFGRDVVTSLIDSETLDFVPGEDLNTEEPEFLPSKIPILLINGIDGTSVSYTSNIPQHNLSEVVDVVVKYIRNKNISPFNLSKGLKPDYVTGGTIEDNGFEKVYYDRDCKTVVKVGSKIKIDNKNRTIYIKNLPIGVSLEDAIQKIIDSSKIKNKNNTPKYPVLQNIKDIGQLEKPSRIYIQCKNGSDCLEILECIKKISSINLVQKFNMNLNVGGKVKRSNLKDLIEFWYKRNYEIRRRKISLKVNKLQNELHIKEGVLSIYPYLDEVIKILRSRSSSKTKSIQLLEKKFKLDGVQAKAICEMPLYTIGKQPEAELRADIKTLRKKIKDEVSNMDRIDDIMIEDAIDIKNKYGRERRTEIIKTLSNGSREINISNGGILCSRNSFGIFDLNNIIMGKKIINGLRVYKDSKGKSCKMITGSHKISGPVKSCVTTYNDGSISKKEFSMKNVWCFDDNTNGDVYITSISPIYSKTPKKSSIVYLCKDNGIKRISISDIGSRKSNFGINVKQSSIDCGENTHIFILNNKGQYKYMKLKDFITKGRTSGSVNCGFSKKDVCRMTLINKKEDSQLVISVTSRVTSLNSLITIDIDDLVETSRISKPKRVIKDPNYIFHGFGTSNVKRSNFGIFVSNDTTFSLNSNNFKKTYSPKKISSNFIHFINVSN